jgi:hypothetical protein
VNFEMLRASLLVVLRSLAFSSFLAITLGS